MVNIVIADDHGVLRGGLRSMLNAEPDMRVVGEAADGNEALRVTEQLRPDILLADISMPGPTGIDVARELSQRQPETQTIVLTMHEDPGLVSEAQEAGAKGYVAKRAAESELIQAIRLVVKGKSYWPRSTYVQNRIPTANSHAAQAPGLTPDETKLLLLIARATTNVQIATALELTPEEVEQRRRQLMEKLGLRSRVDIFRYAQEHGLA